MDVGKIELTAISRMFSASVVRELGRRGRSPLLSRLLTQSGVLPHLRVGATVGDAYDRAFGFLRSLGNRDEYVYRSAVTQKILLGHHNLRTATMLSEARVGANKADMVVLNGTATAYEIKSERDSLTRLRGQIDAYGRVFAAVNVVTSPSHAAHVLRQAPTNVGVLVLSKKFTLQTERRAVADAGCTEPLAMLDFVRVDEAFAILRALGIDPPDVPNTQVRDALRDLFSPLEPGLVHDQMVATLKASRSQHHASNLIATVPASLRTAVLMLRMSDSSEKKVREATQLPIRVALAWS